MIMAEMDRNLNSYGGSSLEDRSASEEAKTICFHPSPSSVLDVSNSAPSIEGISVNPPSDQSLHDQSPHSGSCSMKERAIAEIEDARSGNVESSDHIYAVNKQIRKWQPFKKPKSDKKDLILGSENQSISNVNDSGRKVDCSTFVADPPMSPPISPILNFEEHLHYGNDLGQLGLKNIPLPQRTCANELTDCCLKVTNLDVSEGDEEQLNLFVENLLNEDCFQD